MWWTRARPGAAASGKASGFLALDWSAGTPLDALSRASFAMHRELAAELGPERIGYRPMDALMVAAADEEDLARYRRLPSPDWLDGNVAAHEVIGTPATTAQVSPLAFTTALIEAAVERGATLATGVVDGLALDGPAGAVSGVSIDGRTRPAEAVVLALGPWTSQAQRWLALPQVLGTRMASVTLRAEAPAQAVFSFNREGRRGEYRLYPRPDGTVYVTGHREHGSLPDDPDEIAPTDAACDMLRRVAGVHASRLRGAQPAGRSACVRPLTVNGLPLIGPVPGASGAYLATAHASWGILSAPATGRMIARDLEGGSLPRRGAVRRLRLPAGRVVSPAG